MQDKKIDWRECCNKRLAKHVNMDLNIIESLKKTSENKLKTSEELEINETNASSKFILVYDSLRELLEGLSLKNGYKIYNHECYTAFLKEVLSKSSLGDEFDEIRKIRNAVNYYGKELSIEDSLNIIKRAKKLREYIFNLIKS